MLVTPQPCHVVFNHEGIFTKADINRVVVKNFVDSRGDMNYPIYIDSQRVAIRSLFEPGQNLSIPLAFVITTRDQVVHWIGNPEEMAAPLEKALIIA